jgi:NitT/TauT family transport system permease protein
MAALSRRQGEKPMPELQFQQAATTVARPRPNRWDLLAFPLIFGVISLIAFGAHQTFAPLSTLREPVVSLDPVNLPNYALRTVLRMLAAMVASLVFTLGYGTLAAKSARAERVLIPVLDILQSVPILGYISFTVVFFMSLFPGRVLGAECAVIFAVFTSQAWNMTFSFYQSLRSVPRDLEEATRSFRLSGWMRFWKLEVPYAMPGLIWNMMMSASGGWFFIVASEAITVGDKTITLPGIGAYLATALDDKNLAAVGWVIVAMTAVILAYDQLMFRPLVAWADKFRFEQTAAQTVPESWVLDLMKRTRLMQHLLAPFARFIESLLLLRAPLLPRGARTLARPLGRARGPFVDALWYGVVAAAAAYGAYQTVTFIASELGWSDVLLAVRLGAYTLIRVTVLIAIASVIWVPLGVLIGLRPALAERIQPLAQFLAAFPANLLFPVFVVGIVRFHANPDIWLSPLIVLGTQWYILFNVIAGATAYPTDFREAAINFHVRGWQWWKEVMLPGIFPYFITGAITASGGAWNASIVAEAVSWGKTTVTAHGLGAYIAQATNAGDFPRIVLGIAVMSFLVTLFNRLLWRPLYRFAEERGRLG